MTLLYDAVDVLSIPSDAQYVAAYVDGDYANLPAILARFPHAVITTITVTGRTRADWGDVENGDLDATTGPAALTNGTVKGLYSSVDNKPPYPRPYPWWAADWTGVPHLVPTSLVTQYGSPSDGTSPGNYDVSYFDLSPSPLPVYKGTNMIARNTSGKGYWAVRPSGDVYAFDGAPYLGPTLAYLNSWGIGTATNPVVGITDDGAGGYVLEADTNQYPGQPNLYHIDASGQYKS
jgi:hypothetical protein